MTTDISVQSGAIALLLNEHRVATQSAALALMGRGQAISGMSFALAIFPGNRISVAGSAAFVALIDPNPPVFSRKRRVYAVVSP